MRGITGAIILAAVCGSTNVALAQDALGDGRALDNNLSTRGRLNRERSNLRQELAFRNAIVTGNAPGGLSFRGDVEYFAPGEFSGEELGSNDLFAFRRDSLRSGIAGMGIRGTEALQYQLSLTTGSRPPSNLVGQYTVSRSGSGMSGSRIPQGQGGTIQPEGLEQRPALDPEGDDRGTMLWMLRSPSAYMSNSSLQTSAIRNVQGEDGVYTMTASSLRGVRLSPVPELAEGDRTGATPGSPARTGATNTTPASQSNRLPTGSDAETGEDGDGVETMHGRLLRRLGEQEASRRQENVFDTGPSISERVIAMAETLRSAAVAQEADEATDAADAADAAGRGVNEAEEDVFAEEGDGLDWTREPASDLGSGRRSIRFDPETMRLLRGNGEPVERYVTGDTAGRDFYAEHMKAGQDLMADGRYFDAEERFAHALGLKRGDVTAQVARLHAQIGAGLFLSASLNLQSLIMESPEVFGTRYAADMLPSPDRLDELKLLFRSTITDGTDRHRMSAPSIRRASGVLMAYIGYQTEDTALIREGLDDFRDRVNAGTTAGEPLPLEVRLEAFLRAMWLPEPGGAAAPEGTGHEDG